MFAKCSGRLRLGEPARRIGREVGLSRNTVAGYHRWARQHGLLTSELPHAASAEALSPLPDPVPSPPSAGPPPGDLQGASLSAAPACRELPRVAAEPRGEADAFPGLHPAGPGGGAGADCGPSPFPGARPTHLGLSPPRVARRDNSRKSCATRGSVPIARAHALRGAIWSEPLSGSGVAGS